MAKTNSDDRVGLCARCRFSAVACNRRGSEFWRCLRAENDPAFRRYPPLPVSKCTGFIPVESERPKMPEKLSKKR